MNDPVDFIRRLEDRRRDAERVMARLPGGVDDGGDGPHDSGMEHRVERLEDDMKDLKSDMKAMRADVSEIKGRLANMPTTFQILTWFVGVMLGLAALTFTIAKLAGTH